MDSASLSSSFVELHTPDPVETILFLFILALPWLIGISVSVYLVILLLKKIPQPYSKWTAMFLVTLLCSIFIVFQTLGLPKTLYDPNERNNMICGWSMPFIMIDGQRDPPFFPWTESCISWSGSMPKEILWIPFLTNVAIALSGIWGVIYLFRLIIKGKKRERSKEKGKNDDREN